jgi:hypothetical protein
LERNSSAGKKLLITGSGRCNLTRACGPDEMIKGYGANGRFLKHAVYSFDSPALTAWFSERGSAFITEDSGKIFPASGGAAGIRDILVKEAAAAGVKTVYGFRCGGLSYNGSCFETASGGDVILSRTVIIACGGLSYPSTGCSGDGYMLARMTSHTVLDPRPALAPVICRDPLLNSLSGISVSRAEISLLREGRKIFTDRGDILFTHTGLSGPGVLDMSRRINKRDIVSVNLCGMTYDQARNEFIEGARGSRVSVKGALVRLGIPDRAASVICMKTGVPGEGRAAESGKASIQKLCSAAAGLEVKVDDIGGYNIAMVTAGGVSLKEVNSGTMESRVRPGLFFAGEILDVDGDTGGYNLQAAFSTGRLAGVSAADSL